MGLHRAAAPEFAPNAFAGHLAEENGWTPGRAGVVVRQMLASVGLPADTALTEAEWIGLAQQYFDADVHRAALDAMVGA